jgi:hypothetical protein
VYINVIYPHIKILMISDNVEFLPPIFYAVFWQPFWKWQTSRKCWKRRIAPLMVTYHYVKFFLIIIKSPKQRLETYCFCSVSYYYFYYYYSYSYSSPFFPRTMNLSTADLRNYTISLQTLFGRLNNNKKRSKNNKSPNVVWET